MELDQYDFLILEILTNYNKGGPVSTPTLDRIFYDRRLKMGCSPDNLYDIKLTKKSSALMQLGLIEKKGLSNKITEKGKMVLAKNR
ncbi:MAG: hypothetical protein MI921_11000 [Cytophagales bacterium]|nr:hypothetical protein [Cytophagales bacterium]